MDRFSHEMRKERGALVIVTRGNLDSSAAYAFEKVITQRLRREKGTPVIFDCERLQFLSSSGIRILVIARNEATQNEASVAVCGLQPHIQEVVKVSGLEHILRVFRTRQEALAAAG